MSFPRLLYLFVVHWWLFIAFRCVSVFSIFDLVSSPFRSSFSSVTPLQFLIVLSFTTLMVCSFAMANEFVTFYLGYSEEKSK